MAKSEYFEPKLLTGEKEQPSIPVDADALLDLLLRAEPMMNATNRRRYCDRAINLVLDVLAAFQNAYDFPDDRLHHLKEMCSAVTKFVHVARIIAGRNVIEIPLKHEPLSPESMRLEIFNRIAKLDEGATKWRNSLPKKDKGNKGTTASKEGGGSHPMNKGGSAAAGSSGYE